MTYTLGNHEQEIFDKLWKLHLRHPGMVKGSVVRVIKLNTLTPKQIETVRTEYVRLFPVSAPPPTSAGSSPLPRVSPETPAPPAS